jgi:hypothetical protein
MGKQLRIPTANNLIKNHDTEVSRVKNENKKLTKNAERCQNSSEGNL